MAIPEHWGPCQAVPVAIEKADIAPTGKHKGRVNAYAVEIGSVVYAAGECQFLGFAGRVHLGDKKYHGHHGFKGAPPVGSVEVAFSTIPYFTGTEQKEG